VTVERCFHSTPLPTTKNFPSSLPVPNHASNSQPDAFGNKVEKLNNGLLFGTCCGQDRSPSEESVVRQCITIADAWNQDTSTLTSCNNHNPPYSLPSERASTQDVCSLVKKVCKPAQCTAKMAADSKAYDTKMKKEQAAAVKLAKLEAAKEKKRLLEEKRKKEREAKAAKKAALLAEKAAQKLAKAKQGKRKMFA